MRYYSEEDVLRLIHDGSAKCRRNIELCKNEDEIDGAIGLCNVLSNTVVAILNNEDRQILGRKFNLHRRWCSRAFALLQSEITELDARITLKKDDISKMSESDSKIGFN